MEKWNRRTVLATAGSLAAASALSGCGSAGSSEKEVGDTVEVNGLEVRLVRYFVTPTVTIQPWQYGNGTETNETAGNGSQANQTEPVEVSPGFNLTETSDGGAGTTTDVGPSKVFLVAVFWMNNAGDSPKTVPSPQDLFIADGTISLQVGGTSRDARYIEADMIVDGEPMPSLSQQIGKYQADLPAGESIEGWVAFPVSSEFDSNIASISVSYNPEGTNRTYNWQLD